jgi:hypothetical protein
MHRTRFSIGSEKSTRGCKNPWTCSEYNTAHTCRARKSAKVKIARKKSQTAKFSISVVAMAQSSSSAMQSTKPNFTQAVVINLSDILGDTLILCEQFSAVANDPDINDMLTYMYNDCSLNKQNPCQVEKCDIYLAGNTAYVVCMPQQCWFHSKYHRCSRLQEQTPTNVSQARSCLLFNCLFGSVAVLQGLHHVLCRPQEIRRRND